MNNYEINFIFFLSFFISALQVHLRHFFKIYNCHFVPLSEVTYILSLISLFQIVLPYIFDPYLFTFMHWNSSSKCCNWFSQYQNLYICCRKTFPIPQMQVLTYTWISFKWYLLQNLFIAHDSLLVYQKTTTIRHPVVMKMFHVVRTDIIDKQNSTPRNLLLFLMILILRFEDLSFYVYFLYFTMIFTFYKSWEPQLRVTK